MVAALRCKYGADLAPSWLLLIHILVALWNLMMSTLAFAALLLGAIGIGRGAT
jgi:hypothetical protein